MCAQTVGIFRIILHVVSHFRQSYDLNSTYNNGGRKVNRGKKR